jgi:hypothetical protein
MYIYMLHFYLSFCLWLKGMFQTKKWNLELNKSLLLLCNKFSRIKRFPGHEAKFFVQGMTKTANILKGHTWILNLVYLHNEAK